MRTSEKQPVSQPRAIANRASVCSGRDRALILRRFLFIRSGYDQGREVTNSRTAETVQAPFLVGCAGSLEKHSGTIGQRPPRVGKRATSG